MSASWCKWLPGLQQGKGPGFLQCCIAECSAADSFSSSLCFCSVLGTVLSILSVGSIVAGTPYCAWILDICHAAMSTTHTFSHLKITRTIHNHALFLEFTLWQSVLSSDWISFSVLLSLPPATASHAPYRWTILNSLHYSEDITLPVLLLFPVPKMSFPVYLANLSTSFKSQLKSYFISDFLLPLPGHVKHLDLKPLWR